MNANPLMALSPLDGRYHEKMGALRPIFSEYGFIKNRLRVEIAWLEKLVSASIVPGLTSLDDRAKQFLQDISESFSEDDARQIKQLEARTQHDVKAVEYFLKKKLESQPLFKNVCEWIHFGCTSEDVNNLAYGLMLTTACEAVVLPALRDLSKTITQWAYHTASIAMLARTHGQPATPTTLGKEFAIYAKRLAHPLTQLEALRLTGKWNGATGNYNAWQTAFPTVDWQTVSRQFVESLGLEWNPYTTQIEPHDRLAELFSILSRINTILIDFNRDLWGYVSLNYFVQPAVPGEVGSSTMPHKINPIHFENAEGNLGLANALFEHFCLKLPISRWQRDLSDSTVLRNMGVAIGHALLGFQSTVSGLKKLAVNGEAIFLDLNQHWEVLAEAIQTIMRREGLTEPYEQLKAFTRGKKITKEVLHAFISNLSLSENVKSELYALTPASYIGYAERLALECE